MSNVISNVSIANLTSTWTEDTRIYTGLGLSVTATNYDPASKIFKLMVNGNTVFSVDAAGTLTAPAISVANAVVDISGPFNKANAAFQAANSAANNVNTVYDVVNVTYTVTNSSYTVANASFGVANAAFGFANGLSTIIGASFAKANVAYDLAVSAYNSSNNGYDSANAAGVIANAAFNKANNVVISVDFSPVFNTANAAFDKANSSYTLAASAYDLAFYAGTATNTTAAFAKANAANSLAHETGIGANNYAGFMANAANGIAATMVASNLITARAYTNSATIAANNYAGFMANSSNLYTDSIVSSNLITARAYTNTSTAAANNYAGAMANAVNSNAASAITTLRQYVNTSTVAANAYSGFMSNAVNSYTQASYSTISYATAAFQKANDAYSLVQILSGNSSANIANLQNNLSLINAVYDVANAAFNKANSANVFAFNTDIKTIAAFEKANTLEISISAYAGEMANSSNAYAGVMSNSANGYAESIVASNLITARAYTNSATISANNRAGFMVNSSNGYAESLVAANLITARAYANSATVSSNNYAGVMSNSSNGYAETIVAANLVVSREYTNTSTASANNRAGFMANSANAIAASIVAANLITARAYTNSATVAANNYAGVMANAANANIESTVAAARLYVNTSTAAANNYAGFMANSANGIAATIVAANLVIAREYTNVSVIAANNYAGAMANAVNGAFATADSGVRGYVNTSVAAANNYAGAMANSGNSWASATFATITTVAFNATSANNYAGVMANSANGYAAATYATQSLVSTGLTSANNYSGFMANSGNSWVSATFATQTTLATGLTSANNYAGAMANAANAYALSLGGGGSVISANNYAGAMANAANAYAATVGISANNYAGVMANAANAYASSLSPDLTAANNYAGAMANSANGYAGFMANSSNVYTDSVVASNLVTSRAYTNTSTAAANNYAGFMANAANSIASTIVAANLVISRAYTNTSTAAANNYSGFMANSGNSYAETIVAANLVTSRAYTNTSTAAANNYAGFMANAANAIASTIVAANLTTARSYTDTSTTAANNRAGFMANAANGYAETIVASNLVTSRAYTNTSTSAANNYAGVMANSANGRADTKVATVTGSLGRITSTGGTTPVIDLASGVIADTTTRTGGISSITVDTYGRVTSVTGSAGYTTGSGYLPLSGGTMTGTLTLAGQVWSGNITWNNNINIVISGESSFDVGVGGQWGVWDSGSSNFWMRTNYNDHLRLVENGKNVYVYGGRLYTDASQLYIHAGNIGSYATTGVTAGVGLTGGGSTGALTVSLTTVGAGQATYSSGISAITVDAYGRVTGVTGSANYLPLAGGTMTGRLVQSASGFGVATDDNITTRIDSGFWQTSNALTSTGWPESTTTWYHLITSTHGNDANYFSMQFAGSFYDSNALYYRATNGSGTTAWNKIWHAGNDGAASGLDADLLDGQQGSYYLNVGNMNAGTLGVGRGGTGVASLTTNGVLYGGTTVGATAQGASGTVLTGTGGAPAFSASPTLTTLNTSYLTGARTLNASYDVSNVLLETPTGIEINTGKFIRFTNGIAPFSLYRTTADQPAPYGIGWGNGQESSGIFQRFASNGVSFGEMIFYTGNDGSGSFAFRRGTWESTTYQAAGSNHYGTLLASIDMSGYVNASRFVDINDTAYYTDPAGTSNLNVLAFQPGRRQMVNLYNAGFGIGIQDNTQYYRSGSRFSWFRGGSHINTENNAGTGGTVAMTLDGSSNLTVTGSVKTPIFYHSNDETARWDTNALILRGTSPTVYFRDTDHNSAMIHCNANLLYFLRGANDTETWTQVNSQWPLYINLTNNDAVFGGNITAVGSLYATRYYDRLNAAYYLDSANISVLNQVNYTLLNGQNVNTRDKIRVWSTSSYAIGMTAPFTFGAINNSYAMTFQMNNDSARGFWWGDEAHTNAQGAMSLSTDGKLSVAHSIRAGYGESDTTVPGATYRLDISGIGYASTDFRATSFVDPVSTGFQLTPAGSSYLNTLSVASGFLVRKQDNANEGGEFYLEKSTNSGLGGNITFDNNNNLLRIYEGGGSFRGVYVDFTVCASQSLLMHTNNIGSYATRIKMQSMTITTINTFPALTNSYTGHMFMLIVNGTCFTPADSPAPFSVSGTAITWNAASVWSVNPGDVVTAIYSY